MSLSEEREKKGGEIPGDDGSGPWTIRLYGQKRRWMR